MNFFKNVKYIILSVCNLKFCKFRWCQVKYHQKLQLYSLSHSHIQCESFSFCACLFGSHKVVHLPLTLERLVLFCLKLITRPLAHHSSVLCRWPYNGSIKAEMYRIYENFLCTTRENTRRCFQPEKVDFQVKFWRQF